MCDCIKQIQERVEENFRKTIQPNEEYGYTALTPTAIKVKKDNKTQLETSSVTEVVFIRTTKTEKRREKKLCYNIAHNFCPFCGESYGE